MLGLPYDCLANPIGTVRLTFEKAVASGSNPATFDCKDWGATNLFRNFLFDNEGLSQVPMLNPSSITSLQPNTLVRFRGMIQDMLGNEFYIGAYKDGDLWRTNKFADVSQFPMGSSSDMRVWERRLLYCVPVPGQNSWTESFCEAVLNPFTNSVSPPKESARGRMIYLSMTWICLPRIMSFRILHLQKGSERIGFLPSLPSHRRI